MLKRNKDIYTAQKLVELKNEKGVVFGSSFNEYTILRHIDTANLKQTKGYMVILRQRIKILNLNGYSPGTSTQVSYASYPALLINSVSLAVNSEAQVRLNSFFPRTLNASVSVSGGNQDSSSSSTSHSTTSGSSATNANTYSVSANLGFFGDVPTGGVSGGYSHSTSHTHYHSHTHGTESGHSHTEDHSAAMSVKDWSSFASLQSSVDIQWLWSQTYPWNALNYNQIDPKTKNVILPDYMEKQLYDGKLLHPPSELSVFGVDFVQHASWIVEYPDGVSDGKETIKFENNIQSFYGSHGLDEDKKFFLHISSPDTANTMKYESDTIDLSLYALTPVTSLTSHSPASIGFMVNEFTTAPTKETDSFKIVSPHTNLQVTGQGFGSNMTADFKSKVSMNVYFKIDEKDLDHDLIFIHWLGEGSGSCKIDWKINDKFSGSLLIDANRTRGNDNDLDKVSLRNLDSQSINFHDYLQLGLNEIVLSVAPVDSSKPASYTLSSITVR